MKLLRNYKKTADTLDLLYFCFEYDQSEAIFATLLRREQKQLVEHGTDISFRLEKPGPIRAIRSWLYRPSTTRNKKKKKKVLSIRCFTRQYIRYLPLGVFKPTKQLV